MSGDARNERGFFATSVARPVTISVLLATLIVLGLISYRRLPLQLLPDEWSEPSLYMWVVNRGASARENEEQIARVIEEQLRTMTGIKEVTSHSSEDSVDFQVLFDGTLDIDLAKAEVRDRVERARPQLPATAERVEMWSEDAGSLPITFFGILLKGDEDRRDFLMDEIVVPRLETIPGIGNVDVWGILEDSIRILLDEDAIVAARLDVGEVIQRLSGDNFAMPLGEVNDGGREIILRSDMRFTSIEEIAAYPIGNGLRLSDVGRVARVKSVRDRISRIDGATAYYGMATKDSQANVVEVSRALKDAVEELETDPRLAGEIEVLPFFVQGDIIESALGQLEQTAIWGGALAVVVLFVFLRRVRLTLCVALSIPLSALLALTWQYFTGGTFNLLTMVGITLGIGMLVDNAIVIVENIARFHQEGESGRRAAVLGSREIALAVTLATLTTVVVFAPLIFMTEHPLVRALFGGIGIPLSVSLLASLLVAVVFLPVIAARILGDRPPLVAGIAARTGPLMRLPARLVAHLVALVQLVWLVLVTAAFVLERMLLAVLVPLRWLVPPALLAFAAWRLFASRPGATVAEALHPFGLAPQVQGPLATAVFLGFAVLLGSVVALVGLPLWRRRPAGPPRWPERLVPAGDSVIEMIVALNQRLVGWTLGHRLAATLLALLAFSLIVIPISGVTLTPMGEDASTDAVRFRVSFETQFTLAEASEEVGIYEGFLEERREEIGFEHLSADFDERSARFSLYFEERRPAEEFQALVRRLQEELPRVPGHALRFYEEEQSTKRSQTVVGFTLTGPDSTMLETLGEQAQRILETVPGLTEVSTPLESAPDQIQVIVDRELAHDLGVDSEAVQTTIAWALRGWPLPRFQEQGREVPFLIELDEEEVAGLPTLRDLDVFAETGGVPLASFSSFEFTKGTRSISRRNGQTSFTIEAKVEDPLRVIQISERAYLALGQMELPRGYAFDRSDSALARQQEEFGELKRALLLSIVLVFLVMGVLFESITLPFAVLVTIPFAIEGSLWTLLLTGTPMDFMGWIGLIILAGVVVNNGIVLIDRIHRLSAELPLAEAVVRGSAQRVRPVLMTALTTVCGLLPMILADAPSEGIDYRALATIVAGGLIVSTFFTLWVVPLAYTLILDMKLVVRGRLRWWFRSTDAPRTAAGTPLAPASLEPGATSR